MGGDAGEGDVSPARLSRFHDTTIFHVDDAVGIVEDSVVVGDHEDGRLALVGEFANEFDDLLAHLFIEGGCGLVSEEDIGVADESAGDGDALFLSAGELTGIMVDTLTQADEFEDVLASCFCFGTVPFAVDVEAHADVLHGGQGVMQVVGLEDEAEASAHEHESALIGTGEFFAEEFDGAFLDGPQAADEGQ